MASSDEDDMPVDLFQEPPDYFRPEAPPHFVEHTLHAGQTLQLRLVGSNPLWGHYLWNGAQLVSRYLQTHVARLVHGKTVLELGAGAGLPSLVAAIYGATQVVVTDYPDAELVENLQENIDSCPLLSRNEKGKSIAAEGYLWGADTTSLLRHLPDPTEGFNTLILADLLFNHHCHDALVSTILRTMARRVRSCALVFFSPYRPLLFDKDMAFFTLCREKGLVAEQVLEEVVEKEMFVEEKGDPLLRRTVFGYEVRWPESLPEETRTSHGHDQ